eukprot:25230_5
MCLCPSSGLGGCDWRRARGTCASEGGHSFRLDAQTQPGRRAHGTILGTLFRQSSVCSRVAGLRACTARKASLTPPVRRRP